MTKLLSIYSYLTIVLLSASSISAQEWVEWRGPNRDGVSTEKQLPEKWSPAGENLAWKAPFGGRSTPVVLGDRLYLMTAAGKGADLQERLLAIDADTGKVVWEHRFNLYLSDVPPHRIAWASPVIDAETKNVYALGGAGVMLGLTAEGKVLWERSLGEDLGLLTTHGGRTVSPIVHGDLVIISGVMFVWGEHGRGAHRFVAFDKRTGEIVWMSAPGGRPYDTTYAPPMIANVKGLPLLIQGGSDGQVYAIKPNTGEPVWRYEISKRGLNTGVVLHGDDAILTHSEENLESSEMGMIVAVDAAAKGEIKADSIRWKTHGWQGGFSSPVISGDRLFQLDNGANVAAFDLKTGKQVWIQNLGTIQKASPVLADGKLYVGTENGKFFILQPGPTGAKVLDEDQLGTEQQPESIIASVAVAGGRVFLVTESSLYAIGKKTNNSATGSNVSVRERRLYGGSMGLGKTNQPGPVSHVQVYPTELIIKPGEKLSFKVRTFDERGQLIGESKTAAWSLDKLKGTVAEGQFTSATDGGWQAGMVKATVNGVTGAARVRIVPAFPWAEDFEALAPASVPITWTNTTGKFAVRRIEGGSNVLVKTTEGSSLLTRARTYMGPSDRHDYTVEADIFATQKRRQQGDAGVIAQRYVLTLYGNSQTLNIEPWQPETARTISMPFAWKADTWYRMKLQVENLPDGKVRARGKVWAAGETEPAAWMIERVDPIPNRQGAPGIFGNALAEIYFDNLKVYANR